MNVHGMATKVINGFISLQGSPNELWKAYALKFLDSYSYFSFSVIFTLFLSNDFGYTDIQAGTIYGAWGALVTIFGVLIGFVIDNLGVSKSLKLGFLLSLVSRIGIFLTTSRTMFLLWMCLLSLGNCMGIPVLTTGIRRYTNETNRGFAFGLFYVIMNIAALLSGPIVDVCTIYFKGNGNNEDNNNNNENSDPREWQLSSYRLVVLSGIVANVIACFTTLTVREIKVGDDDDDSDESSLDDDCDDVIDNNYQRRDDNNNTVIPIIGINEGVVAREGGQQEQLQPTIRPNRKKKSKTSLRTFQPVKGSAWAILKETLSTKDFWRFLVVCLITLNVRMIFRHLDATLPKYMIREFGNDVPKGTIYSINPALIIILVPIITAGTTQVDPLVMIHYGSYISAMSVFFLVISTSITSCILFVVFLSIGEAIWSPRLYDYTMTMAKEGREGTYMALSSAPLFLAKLPVGFMSGYLLQKYCPEEIDDDQERQSKVMWLIIGLTTISSPVLLTLCWNYVSVKEKKGGSLSLNNDTTTSSSNDICSKNKYRNPISVTAEMTAMEQEPEQQGINSSRIGDGQVYTELPSIE